MTNEQLINEFRSIRASLQLLKNQVLETFSQEHYDLHEFRFHACETIMSLTMAIEELQEMISSGVAPSPVHSPGEKRAGGIQCKNWHPEDGRFCDCDACTSPDRQAA